MIVARVVVGWGWGQSCKAQGMGMFGPKLRHGLRPDLYQKQAQGVDRVCRRGADAAAATVVEGEFTFLVEAKKLFLAVGGHSQANFPLT